MPLEVVPWGAREMAALKEFLKNTPTICVEHACHCVNNYYDSDVNISAKPHKWIPNLIEYWLAPLNEFRIPRLFEKEHQREMKMRSEANVGVYQGTPDGWKH